MSPRAAAAYQIWPPLLSDGFKEYIMALLTHVGQWVQPKPTHGGGSAKRWQPRTLAMAADLTNRV